MYVLLPLILAPVMTWKLDSSFISCAHDKMAKTCQDFRWKLENRKTCVKLTVSLEINPSDEKWFRMGWRAERRTILLSNSGRQKPADELTWAKETITSNWQTMSRNLCSDPIWLRVWLKRFSTILHSSIHTTQILEKKENQQRVWQKLGRILHVGQLFDVFCHRLYAFIGNQKVVSSEIKSIPMFLHLIKQKRDWGRIVFDQL